MTPHSAPPLHRSLTGLGLAATVWLASAGAASAGANADAVIAAEKARNTALVAADLPAIANLLSDNLRYVHSNGRLQSKQQVLESVEQGSGAYEWMRSYDLVADEVSPDVVVLSGRIDQRKNGSTGWANLILLFQGVWRNETGTWRLVNLQTALPPAPAPK